MFEGIFQPSHLLAIFGIALLVFGPRGFKSAMKEHVDASDKNASADQDSSSR